MTELRSLVDKLISQIVNNLEPEACSEKEKNLVSSFSDGEIIGWINNFDEEEVVDKPFFYSSVISETGGRGLIRSNHG